MTTSVVKPLTPSPQRFWSAASHTTCMQRYRDSHGCSNPPASSSLSTAAVCSSASSISETSRGRLWRPNSRAEGHPQSKLPTAVPEPSRNSTSRPQHVQSAVYSGHQTHHRVSLTTGGGGTPQRTAPGAGQTVAITAEGRRPRIHEQKNSKVSNG